MHDVWGTWICGACGQANETAVDPGGGPQQRYVEDCQICCRPSVLSVALDIAAGEAWITAELES